MTHIGTAHIARVAVIGFMFSGLAFGSFLCPTGQILISGSATTFCVADSGYSNQWFSTNPPLTPSVNFNLLGASAQFLVYTVQGGGTVGEWLSPNVDGNVTSTPVTTSSAVSQVSGTEAASTITDGTVSVAIDSKVINNNIKQTFTVTNSGNGTITSVELVDYFHYFPFGSANPGLGTLSFEPVPTLEDTYVLGLWAHGPFGAPGFVREGGVCGGPGTVCSAPGNYMIDTAANVFAAVGKTATTALPNGPTSRSMDSAGALSWSVGSLNLTHGQIQVFTVELVPEPATFGLMLAGALLCCYKRRKR